MKRLLLAVLGATLLTPIAQTKDLPEISSTVEREIAKQTLPFANERVKQMCKEWPVCEEWVKEKIEQNPSFQVVDAEAARWVSKAEDGTPIWRYRFYVQTKENAHFKAYAFEHGRYGFFYLPPVLIKKFPGHPDPKNPSQHIHAKLGYEEQIALCESWPGYSQWIRRVHYETFRTATSQYVYKYDEHANALWKKRLYVEGKRSFDFFPKDFYFQAYQTKPGGDYTYQGPVEIADFPPRVTFK